MPKNKGISYWHRKVWEIFSKYIRARDAKRYMDEWGDKAELGMAPCISCGKLYPVAGKGCLQAGHFITRKKGILRYDEKNVHAQCYACNYLKKGAWDEYYDAMVKRYGRNTIDELMAKRNEIHIFTADELEKLYNVYAAKLNELEELCPHWT